MHTNNKSEYDKILQFFSSERKSQTDLLGERKEEAKNEVPIHDDVDTSDLAVGAEHLSQLLLASAIRKVADVDGGVCRGSSGRGRVACWGTSIGGGGVARRGSGGRAVLARVITVLARHSNLIMYWSARTTRRAGQVSKSLYLNLWDRIQSRQNQGNSWWERTREYADTVIGGSFFKRRMNDGSNGTCC